MAGKVNSITQALNFLRDPDIAAEYLAAFRYENVRSLLGPYPYCSRAPRQLHGGSNLLSSNRDRPLLR
jgi:hypothetical protein